MAKELKKGSILGTPKQFAIFVAIVIAIAFLCYWWLGDVRQTLAATIFVALVVRTLMVWRFRVGIAFIGILILLLTRTMDLKQAIEFMNMDVIIFLVGMMVVVALLRETGFFRWLGIKMIKLAKYEPRSIMISLLLLSAIPIWWALLQGGCYGGNVTMVGSTANNVALACWKGAQVMI